MEKKIDEMFAFVATEKDGQEGIIGAELNGRFLPLVGADMARVVSLYPFAAALAEHSKVPLKVVKFTNKTDITEEVRLEAERLKAGKEAPEVPPKV